MANTYRVQLSDGRSFNVTTEGGPPSEQDVMAQLTAASAPTFRQEVVGALERGAGPGATVGGIVGGLAGGMPGAAIGGAAGAGYEQLFKHVSELPGTVKDVLRLLVEQPTATAQGFVEGAGQGAVQAGLSAGVQGGSQAIGEGVAQVFNPVLKWGAASLMQSAAKPAIRATQREIAAGHVPSVVKTLLDEGVNVTPGGIEKLNRIIATSNQAIKDALGQIAGETVAPEAVAARLEPTIERFATQVDPQGDVAAIQAVRNRFLSANSMPAVVGSREVPSGLLGASGEALTRTEPVMGQVTRSIPVQEAQVLKTGTYQQLKAKAYGEVKSAEVEAQKALARGLKEEIAAAASRAGIDITALNAREGAAITARDVIAHRVAQVANRDPAGLTWMITHPAAFVAGLMDRSPVVKSLLARGLWQSAEKAANVPANAIRAAVAAIVATPNPNQ